LQFRGYHLFIILLRGNKIFSLDIETLGVESTSVILSVGILYISDTRTRSYQDVLENSIFIKINAKDQIENYKRTVDKNTIEWWKKQGDLQRKYSYVPSSKDVPVTQAIKMCRNWVNSQENTKAMVWTRGSMDSSCLDSLFKAAGEDELFPYNQYRDVRTAIDLIYPNTSKNGYVEVDQDKCPGFSLDLVLKHHPVHDSAADICMLLYGKE